ncbi:MAG TPA: C39 family peptidase [Candidatus Woesebacteria bacterium]|nr:C39 family peptidase [Candidatus Woesebacteria bacterium]
MFKKIIFLFLALPFFLSKISSCYATDQSELEKQIAEYTIKLAELDKAKDTLSNQIKIIDSQVELTLLKISQTENSIKNLEQEINNLTVEIDKLNNQLNELSSIYVLQIIQNYKLQKNIPPFTFLFSSRLNNFLEQYKYVSSIQKASQNSLINMETVRSNYDAQKTAKTKKQQEMETLQKTLASQKITLNNQKIAKNKLLEITKNDAKEYERRLSDAVNQLNSFKSFTTSSGGATLLSGQTRCDDWGCYYNQRDSQWGNIVFGYSDDRNGNRTYYDMKGYGCLITSVTMVLRHYGKSVDPSNLSKDSSLFYGHSGDMLQGDLSTNGINFSRTVLGSRLSLADSELNSGRPVIAGVGGSYRYPAHFIVIKSKRDGQYIINDPYPENGSDKKLSDTNYVVVRIESIKVK